MGQSYSLPQNLGDELDQSVPPAAFYDSHGAGSAQDEFQSNGTEQLEWTTSAADFGVSELTETYAWVDDFHTSQALALGPSPNSASLMDIPGVSQLDGLQLPRDDATSPDTAYSNEMAHHDSPGSSPVVERSNTEFQSLGPIGSESVFMSLAGDDGLRNQFDEPHKSCGSPAEADVEEVPRKSTDSEWFLIESPSEEKKPVPESREEGSGLELIQWNPNQSPSASGQRSRGPFQDMKQRAETGATRKLKACVRCRMQKIRVCLIQPCYIS